MLLEQGIIDNHPAGWDRADIVGVLGMNGCDAQVACLPTADVLDPDVLDGWGHADNQDPPKRRDAIRHSDSDYGLASTHGIGE
jgi:hypothetical protein